MALDQTVLVLLSIIFGGFIYGIMSAKPHSLPWRLLFYVFAALLTAIFYFVGSVLLQSLTSESLSGEIIAKVLANAILWGLISPILGRWSLNKAFRKESKDSMPSDSKEPS